MCGAYSVTPDNYNVNVSGADDPSYATVTARGISHSKDRSRWFVKWSDILIASGSERRVIDKGDMIPDGHSAPPVGRHARDKAKLDKWVESSRGRV